tara:strand:+ start:207 stop:434 length:228 start_codon:yes stop_codon:yes gene_type:complete
MSVLKAQVWSHALDDFDPSEDVVGYCEGCEKSDAVLVDTYREYCEPCYQDKLESDAHADYCDHVTQRGEWGWRDA